MTVLTAVHTFLTLTLHFLYLQASDIEIQLCSEAEKRSKPDPDKLVFGKEFADHMLEIDWHEGSGWDKPRICPLHDFQMHPASKVLHYAVEVGSVNMTGS